MIVLFECELKTGQDTDRQATGQTTTNVVRQGCFRPRHYSCAAVASEKGGSAKQLLMLRGRAARVPSYNEVITVPLFVCRGRSSLK